MKDGTIFKAKFKCSDSEYFNQGEIRAGYLKDAIFFMGQEFGMMEYRDREAFLKDWEILEQPENDKNTQNWLKTPDFSLMKKITDMQENEAHCKEVFEFMAPSSSFIQVSTNFENCLRLIGTDGIRKSVVCIWNDGVIVVEGGASISKPFALVNLIRALGYDKI